MALVGLQLFLLLLLLAFVYSRARLVVLTRQGETTMEPGEKGEVTVNIRDNPAFSLDEYDVIPGQYLNNNKPSVVAKYLLPKRGSLGKIFHTQKLVFLLYLITMSQCRTIQVTRNQSNY